MTDLNKEREAFEQHLIDTGLVEFAGYGFDVDECGEYTHEPTNVAWGTWVIGLNRAKAQAVPDGYVLLPRVPTEKMFQAYERSSVAPMSTLSKTGYKAMVEASESGAEG